MSEYSPPILADNFPDFGVCSFCRTWQRVHDESHLCRNCLREARAGYVPQHLKREPVVAIAKLPEKRRRRRCAACRYTVAGWELCAHHWQASYMGGWSAA